MVTPREILAGTSVLTIQNATQEHMTTKVRGKYMPSNQNPLCLSKSKRRKATESVLRPLAIFLQIYNCRIIQLGLKCYLSDFCFSTPKSQEVSLYWDISTSSMDKGLLDHL